MLNAERAEEERKRGVAGGGKKKAAKGKKRGAQVALGFDEEGADQ